MEFNIEYEWLLENLDGELGYEGILLYMYDWVSVISINIIHNGIF